ncbi:glycosyltransferase [Alkalispirochaeta sphaeroplastigenens]|uniref:glycosyltransferase n=1 Tax=Alkalispirochaeta sphaeroplastigenens TaxID=1187066 RepID=UPI0015E17595
MSIKSDIRFLLVGIGVEFQIVSEYASQAGVLEKNLRIFLAISKSSVSEILSAATISTSQFIDLPEMRNNSANKVFYAMASTTPVAINHEGCQADLLRSEQAGLVLDAHDHRGAAEQLHSFEHDENRLTTAGWNSARLEK